MFLLVFFNPNHLFNPPILKKESLSAHQLAEIFTMEAFDLSSHSFTTGGVIINRL